MTLNSTCFIALAASMVVAFHADAGGVSLGSARTFGVLGASTVTSTGPTTVFGNVGVAPGTAIAGILGSQVTGGSLHAGDAVATAAHADTVTAWNNLGALPTDLMLTGQDLGGLTLPTGVYTFSTSAQLTGLLTLDAQGKPDATFIFQIGSTLTTAVASSVVVINGQNGCNVLWQVGSSATIGAGCAFSGSILAKASITINSGASIVGRALAIDGAVTLDSNHVTIAAECGCVSSGPDLNHDGHVDGADLGLLLGAWGSNDCQTDLNGDGIVDGADLGMLIGAWG